MMKYYPKENITVIITYNDRYFVQILRGQFASSDIFKPLPEGALVDQFALDAQAAGGPL